MKLYLDSAGYYTQWYRRKYQNTCLLHKLVLGLHNAGNVLSFLRHRRLYKGTNLPMDPNLRQLY